MKVTVTNTKPTFQPRTLALEITSPEQQAALERMARTFKAKEEHAAKANHVYDPKHGYAGDMKLRGYGSPEGVTCARTFFSAVFAK